MDDGETTSNISSLADIPPYLKDQYTPLSEVFQAHATTLPSKSSPESNSDAVIRSLKALQEKIKGLEVERVAAAERFKALSQDTSREPVRVHTSPLDHGTPPHPTSSDTHTGLKSRLNSLDERLAQQAQELDAMQRKLRSPDVTAPRASPPALQRECRCTLTEDKLRSLEQGVSRLRAAQSKTKEKVDKLETCFDGSRGGKAKSRPTKKSVDRQPVCRDASANKSKLRKNKGTTRTRARVQSTPTCGGDELALQCVPRPLPGVHYRLDMRDVPFIVGSSTAPSHSVSANYQQVLSLMKSHNHVLCGAAALSGRRGPRNGRQKPARTVSHEELSVLLAGLEEEYGALTFEHQALAQHLQEDPGSQKPRVRASLEMQLKHLEDQLESKSEHIRIVSQQLMSGQKRPRSNKTCPSVATVLEECGQQASSEARSPPGTHTQLCFLKKMKALQSTLQRDDLNWK